MFCHSSFSNLIGQSAFYFCLYSLYYCFIFTSLSGIISYPKSTSSDIESQKSSGTESFCNKCQTEVPSRFLHFPSTNRCVCTYNAFRVFLYYFSFTIICGFDSIDLISHYFADISNMNSFNEHSLQIFSIIFYIYFTIHSFVLTVQFMYVISFHPQVNVVKTILGIPIFQYSGHNHEHSNIMENWKNIIVNGEDVILARTFHKPNIEK